MGIDIWTPEHRNEMVKKGRRERIYDSLRNKTH